MFLGELHLEEVGERGPIDAGADEELFRRVGQRAAAAALRRRWEQGDRSEVTECPECAETVESLGLRTKRVQTLCGKIELGRRVYYCRQCRATYAPLDRRLGTDATGITPGLIRVICRVALELAFEQGTSLLADTLGFSPCSAREVERIANRHGARMDAVEVLESQPRGRRRKAIYCLAIDGTMIPGLPDPQEHRILWHEVKVATVFDPRGLEATFYVAGREDADRFRARLWNELQARGLDDGDIRLVVGDGAPWIWNLVATCFPGVPQLLDFYHASEHLHRTAAGLWSAPTLQTWWQRRLGQLKAGELGNFFAALKLLARRRETRDPEVSPKRLLQYFTDNRERLNYRWALTRNLPIGSGAVESAARHIVQQRLKLSGMRWSEPGAQTILNLRTRHRSGEFEQYWENYAASR